MFADSLLDPPWRHRSRRCWIALLSFSLQGLGILAMLVLSVSYTQSVPRVKILAPDIIAPPRPSTDQASHTQTQRTTGVIRRITALVLRSPEHIPGSIVTGRETAPPMAPEITSSACSGADCKDGNPGVLGSLGSAMPPLLPAPHAVLPTRISRMMEGNLIHRVQPQYPQLAKQARIQGLVVLRAVISRQGAIENLQVLTGDPMLVAAAIDAVKQWRYRPYMLNEQPVEVETQITVKFVLSESRI